MLKLTSVDSDRITSPNVFRVDVGETHVLDDDVLCVAYDADTLSFDYTLGTLTDQALVGANGHAEHTGLVVCDLADLGCFGLVVDAPVVLVDGNLAVRGSSPGGASGFGGSSLGASEVKGFGENDNARRGVGKVVLKLGSGGWVYWCCIAATGYTWYV
jgi:hypothetical protein